MAFSFRTLASTAVLALALVASPAPSSFAHTGSAELPVSLVIHDSCTLDTAAQHANVSCAAGGPYRIVTGQFFATLKLARLSASTDRNGSILEIAF